MEPNRLNPMAGRAEPPERDGQSWLVGGDAGCDHPLTTAVALGLGGEYTYERCLECDGIVVSASGE